MRAHLTALLGAAVLLAGCGSDDEPEGKGIPAQPAATLQERLDEVQRRFDEATRNGNVGACNDIQNDSFKAIDATVAQLPDDVDPDVRETLEDGLRRLEEQTRQGCADVEPQETDTTPEQAPPPETPPEHTDTEPEETTTETTPSEEPPGQKKKDKDNGAGGTPPGQGGGGLPAPLPEEGE